MFDSLGIIGKAMASLGREKEIREAAPTGQMSLYEEVER